MNPLYIVIGVLVLIGGWLLMTYNSFVTLRNRVKEAWSQIDVQLKRRSSLIPNLVEAVKGYVKHEKEVLENEYQLQISESYFTALYSQELLKIQEEQFTNALQNF